MDDRTDEPCHTLYPTLVIGGRISSRLSLLVPRRCDIPSPLPPLPPTQVGSSASRTSIRAITKRTYRPVPPRGIRSYSRCGGRPCCRYTSRFCACASRSIPTSPSRRRRRGCIPRGGRGTSTGPSPSSRRSSPTSRPSSDSPCEREGFSSLYTRYFPIDRPRALPHCLWYILTYIDHNIFHRSQFSAVNYFFGLP